MTAPSCEMNERGALNALAAIARSEAGLSSDATRVDFLRARLTARLRAAGCTDFCSYLRLITQPGAKLERRQLIGALTTNHSAFFREPHHFARLRHDILPTLVEKARKGSPLRLWSAGCAAGQEPYSLAMILLDVMPDAGHHDIRILASDIDPSILVRARDADICPEDLTAVGSNIGLRHVDMNASPPVLRPEVRALVQFRQLNLMSPWPMRRRFSVILCRNVLIYLAPDARDCLLPASPMHWCRAAGCSSGMPNDSAVPPQTSLPRAAARSFNIWGYRDVQRPAPSRQRAT